MQPIGRREQCDPRATVTLVVNRGGMELRVGKRLSQAPRTQYRSTPQRNSSPATSSMPARHQGRTRARGRPMGRRCRSASPNSTPYQVLSHLYRCSRGFFVGGMRPGTRVQVLQGGSVIGTGEAIDGTAAVGVPDGLPAPGASLIARQLICPKPPPPPPPSTGYLRDSALLPIAAFPYPSGQTLLPRPGAYRKTSVHHRCGAFLRTGAAWRTDDAVAVSRIRRAHLLIRHQKSHSPSRWSGLRSSMPRRQTACPRDGARSSRAARAGPVRRRIPVPRSGSHAGAL